MEWDDFNGVVRAVAGGIVVDNMIASCYEYFVAIAIGGVGDKRPGVLHNVDGLVIFLFLPKN